MELPSRVNVLGVGISVLDLNQAVHVLADAWKAGSRGYVCVTGVHGVMESQSDEALRQIHNRSLLTTPDGMPMVWMGRLSGFSNMQRVYGPDLMERVFAWSQNMPVTHFLFGGNEGVAEHLKHCLEQRFPGVQIVGWETPPFRPLNESEEAALIRKVQELKPDFFWVGLSTPKQEKFMAQYLDRLDARIFLGVGAAFDFHTGRVAQAPRWIQRSGLEWFYRLCREPRRLWRRYLTNNPRFLWRIAGQLSGRRRYSLEQ